MTMTRTNWKKLAHENGHKTVKEFLAGLIVLYGCQKVIANKLFISQESLWCRINKCGISGADEKWKLKAKEMGYKNERQMWQGVYYKMSMSDLVEIFWGVSKKTIHDRLRRNGLKRKARGGANHTK